MLHRGKLSRLVFISLLFIAVLAALITPHGQANAQATPSNIYTKTFDLPTTPTTEGAYAGIDPKGAKVVFWHPHTKERLKALKAAIYRFNKENPWKITIQAVYRGSYNSIHRAMQKALKANTPPALTVAYQNEASEYQASGSLVDLNDFVNDGVYGFGSDLTDDFFQGYLASDVYPQFNNARLGMAVYRSMEVLYYNVDALKSLGYAKPPKDWDEFSEIACRWTKSAPGRIGYEVRTDASFIAAAAFAQDGDVYDSEAQKFLYITPDVQFAPQILEQLVTSGCSSVIKRSFADQSDFAKQTTLFYAASSSAILSIQAAIRKTGKPFTLDIAPIPYKTKPIQNIYGASLSIPHTTKAQELAAWLFIRWYTEPAQQAEWAKMTNYFPVRQSTAKALDDYFKNNLPYKSAFDLLTNTKSEPSIAAYAVVRDKVEAAFKRVLSGGSVSEEFAKVNEEANNLLIGDSPSTAESTLEPNTDLDQ